MHIMSVCEVVTIYSGNICKFTQWTGNMREKVVSLQALDMLKQPEDEADRREMPIIS